MCAAAAEHCFHIMIPVVSNYCSDLGNLDRYGLSVLLCFDWLGILSCPHMLAAGAKLCVVDCVIN